MSAQDSSNSPSAVPTAPTAHDDLAASLLSLNLAASTPLPVEDAPEEAETLNKGAVAGTAPSFALNALPPLPPLSFTAPTTTPRTAVLFQPACAKHRYVRNSDIGTIVERPERLRAVKTGVAAAWARMEGAAGGERWSAPVEEEEQKKTDDGGDELGALMEGLSLAGKGKVDTKGKGKEVVGGPFDILETTAVLPLDHAAIRLIHPSPNHTSDPAADAAWLASFSPSTSSSSRTDTTESALSTPSRQTRAVSSSPLKAAAFLSTTSPETPPSWPHQLQNLCRRSSTALLTQPFSEIPPHLPQGDLYLCAESEQAIFGALGAVCEGVDKVLAGTHDRAFVAIRPPGHHCGEASPSGFCFVNNAAVAAAHAHLTHGVSRVIILDIDLHHGNGTQEIVYGINAEANRIFAERAQRSKTPSSSPRKASPKKAAAPLPPAPPPEPELEPLRIYYGSMHDIWSYPCEDGDPSLVQAASLVLSGGHGQYISNVHLETYADEEDFHAKLYPKYRDGLLGKAEEFLRQTAGGVATERDGERTLVIVSAGFDASHHEYPSMSRHARHVPTSFYRRFARDVVAFSKRFCGGNVLSVLEGGYSDRALASAMAAFLTGLTARDEEPRADEQNEQNAWWAEPHLVKLEKACSPAKARRGGAGGGSGFLARQAATGLHGADPLKEEAWLVRAVEIFARIEGTSPLPASAASFAAAARSKALAPKEEEGSAGPPRQLRERKVRYNYAGLDDGSTPVPSPVRGAAAVLGRRAVSTAAAVGGRAKKEPSPPPPLPPAPPPVPLVEPVAPAFEPAAPSTTGATPSALPEAPKEAKQTIKITWKAGGFMGDPRM
ncbi:hypothetical protein JCM6882_001895 [Rhodosporidiobolus microsporus]